MLPIALVGLQLVLIGALLWPAGERWPGGVALLLLAAGMLLGSWALAANRPGNFNIRPEAKPDGRLVQGGPYRFVRHPMYVALLVACAGLVAWQPAAWRAAAWLALALVLHAKTVIEEASMLRRHAGYAAYRARTRRWIPFVW